MSERFELKAVFNATRLAGFVSLGYKLGSSSEKQTAKHQLLFQTLLSKRHTNILTVQFAKNLFG